MNVTVCKYCCDQRDTDREPLIDDEFHFLVICKVFDTKRNCLFGKVSAFDKVFINLTDQQKMALLLCPSNIHIAKLVNKFINIVLEARKCIDRGENMDLGYFSIIFNDSALSDSNNDS